MPYIKLLLVSLALVCGSMARAQSAFTIVKLTGDEAQYALSAIGKLTFGQGNMYLYDKQGNLLATEHIAGGGKIIFSGSTSHINTPPNSHDNIHISYDKGSLSIIVNGLSKQETIRIFSLSGSLVKATRTQTGHARICISDLCNGTYILQVQTKVFKFIKR